MGRSFINQMLFGNQDEDDSYKPWNRKKVYISEEKLKEEHMKKFHARQLQIQKSKELAEQRKNSSNIPQEKITPVKFIKTEPVVPKKPDYITKMTVEDMMEMVKEKEVFTAKQIEDFFESKVNQKVCFEGVPVIVSEVFSRSEGIAVQFTVRKNEIGQLTFNRSLNQKNNLQASCTVDITGSGPVKLFGEIQGSINEKFKVLFS